MIDAGGDLILTNLGSGGGIMIFKIKSYGSGVVGIIYEFL